MQIVLFSSDKKTDYNFVQRKQNQIRVKAPKLQVKRTLSIFRYLYYWSINGIEKWMQIETQMLQENSPPQMLPETVQK